MSCVRRGILASISRLVRCTACMLEEVAGAELQVLATSVVAQPRGPTPQDTLLHAAAQAVAHLCEIDGHGDHTVGDRGAISLCNFALIHKHHGNELHRAEDVGLAQVLHFHCHATILSLHNLEGEPGNVLLQSWVVPLLPDQPLELKDSVLWVDGQSSCCVSAQQSLLLAKGRERRRLAIAFLVEENIDAPLAGDRNTGCLRADVESGYTHDEVLRTKT